MRGNSNRTSFIHHLRRDLNHLYDPAELGKSPLAELFSVGQREDRAPALRRILIDAIESLKPEANAPPQSNA